MNKQKWLKWVNLVLFILMLNQFVTGFFHEYISHEWFEILHEGGAWLLFIFIILHLWLNLNWVKVNFFKKS